MSILANKDTRVVIQGGQAGVNAARRMAEFCYLIKRPLNVEAFVYPTRKPDFQASLSCSCDAMRPLFSSTPETE